MSEAPDKPQHDNDTTSIVTTAVSHTDSTWQIAERLGVSPKAVDFVHVSVYHALHADGQRRQRVSAQDIAWAVRELAGQCFGPLARTVLEHWGIRSTSDIGRIVEALCEEKMLVKEENDRIEDFDNVYDFEKDFEYELGKGLAPRRAC